MFLLFTFITRSKSTAIFSQQYNETMTGDRQRKQDFHCFPKTAMCMHKVAQHSFPAKSVSRRFAILRVGETKKYIENDLMMMMMILK